MDISSQRVRIHIPIPILWDSDELQHQECLKQLEIAGRLCSIRNDSPEAERLYREYMKIHQHWLDEQQAIEEQEQGKNLHSYDERWSAVGQGYPLSSKDSWISSSTSCESKPTEFRFDAATTATSLSALQLPPPSISPSATANQSSHAVGSKHIKPKDPEHLIAGKGLLEITMSERTRIQALSEVTSDAERAARNETAMRSNITECPSTPVFPPLLGNPDILPHGEVRCIISHMPWESRKLLYCIVWKPYDVDVVPILWWVKFSALVYHYALVNDYHYLHRIDPPPWPKKQYPRLTACLGVREIMRALEERKAYLIVHGFSDEEAAREVTNERWRMRDEWQQTGRGWGSAKEIVQKRRKEWIEGEHFMKHWRDEIDEMIESNTPTDQPLQEGTAGVSKQCSEHILRHGSSQRGQTGSGASKEQFDTRDELEWRENFAEMLARGKTALPPQKGYLLQSQRSNNSQPLSRVVSTLKKDSKRPNSQQGHNTHEETVPSLGDPVIISGSNETASLDTVRLRSHSFGNKLFSGMFRKLTWRHYLSPTSSPHHSRPCTPCKSAGCNYSNTGASQATTEHEPQCNCLDGASKSEEEAQSHVNSPGITAVDLNAPADTDKQLKKAGALFSFPRYEASASQMATPYFRYNPPSTMCRVSAGESIAGKDSATGNSSLHQHQNHYHAPKQPEKAPETEQVHESELWLDGSVSPISERCRGQNTPHSVIPHNNCSDTSSDGSDTPRNFIDCENPACHYLEDDWSGFDSGPSTLPQPLVVEEEVLDDEDYCVIMRPAVRELPVLLCPYCSCPLEDPAHACKAGAEEQRVATPKRPVGNLNKSRQLKSEVGKRKGPRLEAVREEPTEPTEGGGMKESIYNARVQNLILPASAFGGAVVMKKIPRQVIDEKKTAGIFERAWGSSGSEKGHSNAYILARGDLYS